MSIKPSSVRTYLSDRWQAILSDASLALITLSLLCWHLRSLVPGYSASELVTLQQSRSLHDIIRSPIDLPYVLLTRVVLFVRPHSLLASRLVSVVLALITVGIFYWLIQHWHGRRIAWMSAILFATSTRFLHTARLGTPQILLFGLFALVAYGVWLKERTRLRFALPLGLFLACLFLYVPGMIWFVFAGLARQWRTIVDKIWKTPVWLTLVAILPALAILFPLAWAIVRQPRIATAFIGIPQPFPHISQILHNLANVPLQLFYTHSVLPSDLGTPALLTLDSFAVAMFIFGGYLYLRHLRLVRTSFLIGILVLGCALIGLGTMSVTVLFPFIYMIIAAGLAYMLDQWLRVFPRNIFARSTDITLLSLVIILCCTYNVRRYFVAWPDSSATQAIFNHRPA